MNRKMENFERDKMFYKATGVALIGAGALLLFLWLVFPFPFKLFFATVFAAFALGGLWIYYNFGKNALPINEALKVSGMPEYKGVLTPPDIVKELGVELQVARKILDTLVDEGYARARKRGEGDFVWRISSSKQFDDGNVLFSLPTANREVEDFIALALESLAVMEGIYLGLSAGAFQDSVGAFNEIVERHLANFRQDPSDMNKFSIFPELVKKMREMLEQYVDLSRHQGDAQIKETLQHTEKIFADAVVQFNKMLQDLLQNDATTLEINARTMEHFLKN